MTEKKTIKDWWQQRTKNQKIGIIIGGNIVLGAIGGSNNDKPNPCGCISLLELKKDKLDYVPGMSNEDYRKWEKCYDAYAGPATATLKCADK